MKKLLIIGCIEWAAFFCIVSLGFFNYNDYTYSAFVVTFFSFQFFYFLFFDRNKKREDAIVFFLMFIAFIVRMFLIIYDANIKEIDPGDCHDFRVAAEYFFYTNIVSFRNVGFTFTTLFMGIIDKVFGPQRIILQYWGAMSFLLASYITYRALIFLKADKNIIRFIILWMLFTPQNIKNTSISNREGFISLFVATSIYLFLMYVKSKKVILIVLSCASATVGAMLHSAVLFTVTGFIVYFVLFSPNKNYYTITSKSLLKGAFIVLLIFVVYSLLGNLMMSKFGTIESVSDIASVTSSSHGGSSYDIAGASATSVSDLILYTPIRAVYFLLSPMPWDWRGVQDIIAFSICGFPHIIIVIKSWKTIKVMPNGNKKGVLIALLISAIMISIVFGWGVKNAGTAIRHRDKFLSLYACILGILLSEKKEVQKNGEKNSYLTGT